VDQSAKPNVLNMLLQCNIILLSKLKM